jgi:hypothetical protein
VATSTHGISGVGCPWSRLPNFRKVSSSSSVVVVRVVGLAEVVLEVAVEQDGHQVGGRHRRGRMAGVRDRGCPDRIDP